MRFSQAPGETAETQMEALMASYGDSLLRLCFLYLQDQEMARDAVQETFLKAYKKWDSFKGESSVLTWLSRIAINTCRDMRKTAWFRLFDRRVALEDLPEPGYIQAFRDDTVLKTVSNLPEKYRVVILLYYYQELTQGEIAQALGLPVATVKTRLKRAKDQLRTQLKGWFEA
ncbi:MAG: sigma-70 family RNA polymerase sigma factor [Clostridiales bacterium]|nr:sigma-70 family RNA polymerase sigma factor [Clostridiales bacterium]